MTKLAIVFVGFVQGALGGRVLRDREPQWKDFVRPPARKSVRPPYVQMHSLAIPAQRADPVRRLNKAENRDSVMTPKSPENAFSGLSRRRPRVQVPSTPQVKYRKIILEFGPCSKTCSCAESRRG